MRPDIDIRSYLDTLSGKVVLLVTALCVAGIALAASLLQPALFPNTPVNVEITVIAVTLPLSLLIPVIAVIMTAGEWSDRSIQTTLLQRPGRLSVLGSKLLATIVVVLAVSVLSVLTAMAATWLGGAVMGEGSSFSSMQESLANQGTVLVVWLLFAAAMGVFTQSTVLGLLAAIGLPFVVSTARPLAALAQSDILDGILRAVDINGAAGAIGHGKAEAFDALPLLLLVALPLAVGAWRWSRREIG